MKKLLLLLIFGMFLISLVSAVNECGNDNSFLGTFKQGATITLKQTCDDCTYVNLSSVDYPNSTKIVYNTNMTKNGIEFTITSKDTSVLGCYSYVVYGDKGGTKISETIDYLINPSGQGGSGNSVFYIIIILLAYGISVLGFYNKNDWIIILGGGLLIGLGLYMINNGIINYRDWYTNYLSYVTLGYGTITGLIALFYLIDENI